MLAALGALGAGTGFARDTRATNHETDDGPPGGRLRRELRTRVTTARARLSGGVPARESNSRLSEAAVVSKFGKSLAHDLDTGLPTTAAYGSLVRACDAGEGYGEIEQATFDLDADEGVVDEIEPSPLVDDEANFSPRPLVQPESAWSYLPEGHSTAQLEIARPPAFDSAEAGAEMVELYWRALTRDVPFREYPDSGLVREAVTELRDLPGYRGPGSDADPRDEPLTARTVFRGIVPGAQTGPYVSQFLLKDRVLGRGVVDQRIEPQAAEETPRDYMTDAGDWLKIQRGVAPASDDRLPGNEFADERRYIVTGRDMAERVHDDPPYRQIQKAAQMLIFSMRAPLDDGIPYAMKPFDTSGALTDAGLASDDAINGRETESSRDVDSFLAQTTLPFNDFGPLYIEKKAVEASEHGQKAAWYHKWNVHRRLRPEEYGGRIEATLGSDLEAAVEYPIPDSLRSSEALEETVRRYDSHLLPQAYAEGSPTHPSYPAGHSVVAGAGVTVLKAFFDGDYVFAADEKVVPNEDGTGLLTADELSDASGTGFDVEPGVFDELTVRGELNKLAANMALGRNRAGIHYRTDGIEGLRLGEAAALAFLADQLSLPNVDGVTLSLETFDGESVTVEPTA